METSCGSLMLVIYPQSTKTPGSFCRIHQSIPWNYGSGDRWDDGFLCTWEPQQAITFNYMIIRFVLEELKRCEYWLLEQTGASSWSYSIKPYWGSIVIHECYLAHRYDDTEWNSRNRHCNRSTKVLEKCKKLYHNYYIISKKSFQISFISSNYFYYYSRWGIEELNFLFTSPSDIVLPSPSYASLLKKLVFNKYRYKL